MKKRPDLIEDSETFLSSSLTEVTHFKQHLIYPAGGDNAPLRRELLRLVLRAMVAMETQLVQKAFSPGNGGKGHFCVRLSTAFF